MCQPEKEKLTEKDSEKQKIENLPVKKEEQTIELYDPSEYYLKK